VKKKAYLFGKPENLKRRPIINKNAADPKDIKKPTSSFSTNSEIPVVKMKNNKKVIIVYHVNLKIKICKKIQNSHWELLALEYQCILSQY